VKLGLNKEKQRYIVFRNREPRRIFVPEIKEYIGPVEYFFIGSFIIFTSHNTEMSVYNENSIFIRKLGETFGEHNYTWEDNIKK
jgi:hypothetical protein